MQSIARCTPQLTLLLLMCICTASPCHAKSFQSLTTTDLSFNAGTQFSPGNYIRYNVRFTVPLLSLAIARGRVAYANAPAENLTVQFALFGKGDQQIFWDSIVPRQADGSAEVRVTFLAIPGGFAAETATFTVSGEPAAPATYIGSEACATCHAGLHPAILSAYEASGHRFALSAVTGGPPVYPSFAPGVPLPPAAVAWSDISYVVGGYGWAANFLYADGSLVTGSSAQYNLAFDVLPRGAEFVAYEPLQAEPKPFTCGACHATGYQAEGSQSGLAYAVGTWSEDGVGCEGCHGPGSDHQANPAGVKPAADPAASCAGCHAFGDSVMAAGGFIVSQQQAAELGAGAKSSFACTSCHNAHASARYDGSAGIDGAVKRCTSCHGQKPVGLNMAGLACIDCHMPYAVKSGASISFSDTDGNSLGQAAMRTHIFTINSKAEKPADLFTADGSAVATGADGRAAGLTLDFVCLGCHRPGGRSVTTYSYSQVKAFASAIHQ